MCARAAIDYCQWIRVGQENVSSGAVGPLVMKLGCVDSSAGSLGHHRVLAVRQKLILIE